MSKTELSVHGSIYEQGKAYIARITGLDKKFGVAREFIATRKSSNKSGKAWDLFARVDDGLYELSETGKRGAERRYVAKLISSRRQSARSRLTRSGSGLMSAAFEDRNTDEDAALIAELREALSKTLALLKDLTAVGGGPGNTVMQEAKAVLARAVAHLGAAQ